MNLNDIIGNTDRQKMFDTILEEACRQWCAVLSDSPERMDGKGFANFFYETFAQQEKEAEHHQEVAQSPKKPSEKAKAHVMPKMETDKPVEEDPTVADSPPKSRPVQEEQVVQEFLKLLMENRPDKGLNYSTILLQMDVMTRQFEAALQELQKVKQQLAQVQESPTKNSIARLVSAVENQLHVMQERLSDMKDHIVKNAKQAVAGFAQKGVEALDKAVAALGVKKGLEVMRQDISESISGVRKSIEKIETIGHELRSAGGHVKNVGRAVINKEQQPVDGGREGRFQAAILAPMRTEKKILSQLNNMALAAIGSVERLEQVAGQSQEQPETQEQELEEWNEEPFPEKPATKEKEKPSVLKDLQEKKTQAATRSVPTLDKENKERKPQEAAL